MIIEIANAGFVNKGAELMLYAVLERLRERYPQARYVMSPSSPAGPQPFPALTAAGFYPKASLWFHDFQLGGLAKLVPAGVRARYGVILDEEVDVVIDAAGFAYSDQLGERNCVRLAKQSAVWRRNGTKVILLPQAMGPFETSRIRRCVKTFVKNVDLIFPRDSYSFGYLTDVVGEQPKIRQFPDFTNLLGGTNPRVTSVNQGGICVIPNYRMIDMVKQEQSDAYLPFLVSCTRYLHARGEKPFLLIHESGKDIILAEAVTAEIGNIPIVIEQDPRKIKAILGQCRGVVGSRYHGLISALSQGVPSLAVGWSHKYETLFEEYGFPEGIIKTLSDEESIFASLDLLLEPGSRERIQSVILERGENLRARVLEMWEMIFSEIEKSTR